MRTRTICFLMIVLASSGPAQEIKNIRTMVGSTREVGIEVEYDTAPPEKLNSKRISLHDGSGNKVYCSSSYDTTTTRFVRYLFEINSANLGILERLVSDSAGYFLDNEDDIVLGSGVIEKGALKARTLNRIRRVREASWKEYILNEYSSQFLFPHRFKVGTRLGLEDSTKTVYFLDVVQSDSWASSSSPSYFWGLKARWSTDMNDKLNFIQFYPFTILLDNNSWRIAGTTGVETDYSGFGKFGRGVLKGELQFRLPYNPINLTMGSPRWRINPVISLSAQGNLGWGKTAIPDSVKHSYDLSIDMRYDVPVANKYYLQTNARGSYVSVKKEVVYQFECSLGYIAGGDVRIMASYEQGYQDVTYQFDRQLLLGFAFDILNQSVSR